MTVMSFCDGGVLGLWELARLEQRRGSCGRKEACCYDWLVEVVWRFMG